jgi:hypothetical protein
MDLGKPETGHQMTTVPVPFVVQTKPPSEPVLDNTNIHPGTSLSKDL